VKFLAALAPGGRALEFAIGTGRVALPLNSHGLTVSGIDSSAPMVAVLREKPGADRIEVTVGDMARDTVPGLVGGSSSRCSCPTCSGCR
jgi:ubiquinone/menaquinone biosynthesis C-methylase UbiE